MGLFSLSQSLGFAGKILDNKVSTEPIIEMPSFKPMGQFSKPNTLPRCTPEEEGIPSSLIHAFLKALSEDKTLNMHSITVVRNGRVLCEATFGAQKNNIWKYTFSACKSVTSLAIGILIDEGLLGLKDRVADIFPKEAGAIGKMKLKDLTVEALLTMRSGVFFTELDSVSEANWLKGFFNAPIKGEVGKTFRYNSLNTYILSAIVVQKTGETLSDFLQERLFTPLAIGREDWYWEPCPQGIEKGGWGLYIRPDDLSKIAQLVMQKGVWNGTRIISEEYITAATSAQVEVLSESTRFDYGYQIWVGKQTDTFLFNGLFGQNVLGFWRNGIIVTSNAGNSELFQQSNFFKYVIDFFDRDFGTVCSPEKKASKALRSYISSLSFYEKKKRFWKPRWWKTAKLRNPLMQLVDTRFVYSDGYEKAVGFLPLVLQAVHNCYTKGFVALSFRAKGDTIVLQYEEQEKTTEIPLGVNSPCIATVTLGETPYTVASSVRFLRNEDDCNTLVIRIDFLEFPSSRVVKLIFLNEETAILRNEELPGEELAKDTVKLALDQVSDMSVISTAVDRIGSDFFEFKAERIFSPQLILKKEIIAEESKG